MPIGSKIIKETWYKIIKYQNCSSKTTGIMKLFHKKDKMSHADFGTKNAYVMTILIRV